MPSSGFQTCARSEEHTSELQSHDNLVCRLLLEKKNMISKPRYDTSIVLSYYPVLIFVWILISENNFVHFTKRLNLNLFFLNDPVPTELYTLSLHHAFPT